MHTDSSISVPVQTGKYYTHQIRFGNSSLALKRVVGLNMRVGGTNFIAEFFLAVDGDLGDTDIEGFLNDVIYARYCV